MLTEKEQDIMEDRLAELEYIRRELSIIQKGSFIAEDSQKQELLAQGLSISYQQGQLDAWIIVEKILEGETDFYDFSVQIQHEMRKKQTSEKVTASVDVM